MGIDSRGWGKNRKAALSLEKAGTEKEMSGDVVTQMGYGTREGRFGHPPSIDTATLASLAHNLT